MFRYFGLLDQSQLASRYSNRLRTTYSIGPLYSQTDRQSASKFITQQTNQSNKSNT